ncbi:hypothetical protein KL921_004871 [Ogataea angusta]|uniref:CRAL-TRIO domain-containing protein n=1 Tax=Pichia angusta TaxID=870730 RepID=A0AAN6I331_PICAN|nr:uncharacterized protein KL928_005187 [Ogataea angusta]KAG7806474.1 hypothetical protein KL921_004871 [Ogataea angusta]KAG7815848.1 hypothetical protein KL928_005187 [Ogataea angusta]KAG7826976.1 hypothetical protein KL920_004974 [Ogataea angusta]KAG7832514.1 hypothetical protein KL943_004851 [Ogataea angusta]KAG7836768.1 hypothetical protein KL942_004686 [Ogataea angusta]
MSIPEGRAETLTSEQAQVLKTIWKHYLQANGYTVGDETAKSSRHNTLSSVKSSESIKKSRKKGLLGRFRRSHSHKKAEEELSSHLSHDLGGRVHEAFRPLDAETRNAFWDFLRHDTPDNLLLRFVRARKWDVDKSLAMIANTMDWRRNQFAVERVFREGELGMLEAGKQGVLKQFATGKCVIRGQDKKGRPIVIIRPRYHFPSDQTEEEVELFTILVIEYARLLINEPVDSCSLIFDLTGFSMSNMDYTSVKFIIKAFEAHYPESLGVLFIHSAPWIFGGIWNIVKNWLDPVVASKIQFTKKTDDLLAVIDKAHVPKDLGGDDEYEWKYLEPTKEANGKLHTDEKEKEALEHERHKLVEQFINKTIEWIECADQDRDHHLMADRLALGRQLAENYKRLDGYIRNRGIYDRLGYIKFE